MRKRQLLAQGYAGRPNRFITLTSNPAVRDSAGARAQALARAWRLIVKRLRRLHPNAEIAYLAVMEKTLRGEPHLHILFRGPWVSQAWLSDVMRELEDAPIVDIRHVADNEKAVRYVTKYVGKDPERFPGAKRYWSSQNWQESRPPPLAIDPLPMESWTCHRVAYEVLIQQWNSEGWSTLPFGTNMVLAHRQKAALTWWHGEDDG